MCCRPRPLLRASASVLVLGLLAAGCGNKKPPQPPLRLVPERTSDLEVSQRGLELQFSLSYPTVTTSGEPLTGLQAIELRRMTRPLALPVLAEDEEGDATAPAAEPRPAPESGDAPDEPPTTPFLFVPPAAAGADRLESRVQVDEREFGALAEEVLRIEGAELDAAISGSRILLRLPLTAPPAPEGTPDEERVVEIFAVASVSPKGLSSELSNLVKILPRVPPPPPSQLETRPGPQGIELDWQADEPPVGFRVYRRDAASRSYAEPIASPPPDQRSHLDVGARFDTRSVYTVTSVALERPLVESALSAEREVDYQDRYPPAPPAGLIVLAEPGRARLLWEPSPADDLAGYLVYRRDASDAGFLRISGEPALEIGYLDTTVASGRGYSYYVSAVDRSGNESGASETADAVIP